MRPPRYPLEIANVFPQRLKGVPVSRLDQTGHSQDREANRHPRSRWSVPLSWAQCRRAGCTARSSTANCCRVARAHGGRKVLRHDTEMPRHASVAVPPATLGDRSNGPTALITAGLYRPMSGTSRPCVCRVLLLRRRCAQSSTSPQDQSVSQTNTDVIIPQQFLQSALDWPPQTHQSQLRQPTSCHIPTAFLRGILRLVEGRPRTWRP